MVDGEHLKQLKGGAGVRSRRRDRVRWMDGWMENIRYGAN